MAVPVIPCLLSVFALLVAPGGPQDPPATGQTPTIVERLLDRATTRPGDEVIARYEHATLTRSELMDFLVQTRGLDALLNLMQLQIAKALADNEGITVTVAELEAEKRQTLRQAFGEVPDITELQYEELLEQLLIQQQLSRTEFDVVMATNAYLKALARPRIDEMLTEENLRKAFSLRYGEQVRVRHIQLENMAQVAEVRKRLEAGEDFVAVATQVSRNADTKRVGGLFPPFSIQSDLPEAFKVAAFDLEVGKISDPVEAGGFFHLIRLEERIAPKAVEFEDVRDELKKTVAEEQLLAITAQLRRLVAQMLASENLQVIDPALRDQLRTRLAALRPQPLSPEELTGPLGGTGPASAPATGPAPRPRE